MSSNNLFSALRAAFPADLTAVAVETDEGLRYSWQDLDRATAMMANPAPIEVMMAPNSSSSGPLLRSLRNAPNSIRTESRPLPSIPGPLVLPLDLGDLAQQVDDARAVVDGVLHQADEPDARTEAVREIEDLRGQRFRSYNVLTTRMAELMGAAPVTVQVAEIPQAFATGVIAAMFTSAQTGVDTAAWDYARVFTDVGGMRAKNYVFANTRAFRALDEATRNAVLAAAQRAAVRGLAEAKAAENEMSERLRSRGMQVVTPSAQLMTQLREIGARQTQEWAQRAGPEGAQVLERYRAAMPR